MSRTSFCRVVTFKAKHHYWDSNRTQAENRALFGEASEPHEHTWRLTVWLEGPLNEYGMIVDLPEVDRVLDTHVVRVFDGGHINEADPWFRHRQPTTEVLAEYFAERLGPLFSARLARLRIEESDDLFSEWTP